MSKSQAFGNILFAYGTLIAAYFAPQYGFSLASTLFTYTAVLITVVMIKGGK